MNKLNLAKLRRLLASGPFLNPYYDSSDPALWWEEIKIVQLIIAGEKLVTSRFYHDECKCYAVMWYWETYPNYPRAETNAEYDGPVMRLMSRGVIRQVQCAGGADRMVLTEAAERAIAKCQKAPVPS